MNNISISEKNANVFETPREPIRGLTSRPLEWDPFSVSHKMCNLRLRRPVRQWVHGETSNTLERHSSIDTLMNNISSSANVFEVPP